MITNEDLKHITQNVYAIVFGKDDNDKSGTYWLCDSFFIEHVGYKSFIMTFINIEDAGSYLNKIKAEYTLGKKLPGFFGGNEHIPKYPNAKIVKYNINNLQVI